MLGIRKAKLGLISTLVVGGFVGYQYFDSKWKSRIERSLNYAVLAQEPDKVAARNASDLWRPVTMSEGREVDLNLIIKELSDVNDPDFIKQHITETHLLNDPEASKKFSEILAEEAVANIARVAPDILIELRSRDEARAAQELVNSDECYDNITSYVENRFDGEESYKGWRTQIITEDGFVTTMGNVIEKDGKRYWLQDEVPYHYTWPPLLRDFFRLTPDGKMEETSSENCRSFIDHFEKKIEKVSPGILDNLHELKNFYSAVSICTISGLCDSQVTCEIFNADVYRFQEKWRDYFEIWSASQGDSGYFRIPGFTDHCNSNVYFLHYQKGRLKWYQRPIYHVRNFWNLW